MLFPRTSPRRNDGCSCRVVDDVFNWNFDFYPLISEDFDVTEWLSVVWRMEILRDDVVEVEVDNDRHVEVAAGMTNHPLGAHGFKNLNWLCDTLNAVVDLYYGIL